MFKYTRRALISVLFGLLCLIRIVPAVGTAGDPSPLSACPLGVETPDSVGLSPSQTLPARLPYGLILDPPAPGPALREPDLAWVDDTLASMTLEEKIGQMIISTQPTNGVSLIDNYHVGGFCFLGNGQLASNIVTSVNNLQTHSPFPLWFSIDAEAGLGARVADATVYPLNMGFGAANDPALTELAGRITARECRALGIQIAFGPCVDVNTEPINPIISTRSYGDRPGLVTRMSRGFIAGARSEGILCTFKHYPGHGGTEGDSHSSLPTIDLPIETLQSMHIKPYRDLAGTGDVDLVMTAHVWYSAVDNDYGKPWPATLSPRFLTDILRGEIGYKNLVISDSYGMSGLAIAVPDQQERAVKGIQAGLDIVLGAPDVGEAFTGIRAAVLNGTLSEARINESVRRVLIAKSRVGLPENTTVDPTYYTQVLRHPDHLAAVRQVCEKSFTCMKNDLTTSPTVPKDSKVLLLTLGASTSIFYRMPSSDFTDPFIERVPDTDLIAVSTNPGSTERGDILAAAPGHDVIVVAGYDWSKIASTRQITLMESLIALDIPVIYVGFGAPYHYTQIPGVDAMFCGYSSATAMQQVAAEVLTGERKAVGRLPVTVPGLPAKDDGSGWVLQ